MRWRTKNIRYKSLKNMGWVFNNTKKCLLRPDKTIEVNERAQTFETSNPTKAHKNTLKLIAIERFWLFEKKNVFSFQIQQIFKSNKLDSCNFGYLVGWTGIKCDKILEEISKGYSLLQLSVSLSAFLVGKFSPIVFLSMGLSKGTRGWVKAGNFYNSGKVVVVRSKAKRVRGYRRRKNVS